MTCEDRLLDTCTNEPASTEELSDVPTSENVVLSFVELSATTGARLDSLLATIVEQYEEFTVGSSEDTRETKAVCFSVDPEAPAPPSRWPPVVAMEAEKDTSLVSCPYAAADTVWSEPLISSTCVASPATCLDPETDDSPEATVATDDDCPSTLESSLEITEEPEEACTLDPTEELTVLLSDDTTEEECDARTAEESEHTTVASLDSRTEDPVDPLTLEPRLPCTEDLEEDST